MFGQLGVLMDRLRDLSELIITAAWSGAMGFGVAALVATLVMRLEPPLGFGWSFFGWWLLAAALFLPALVVWWFARNARLLRGMIEQLPQRLSGLAEGAVSELVAVASAARETVQHRRGLMQLVSGAWQMRKVTATFRDLAGAAAPVTATFAPTSLLVTAVAAAGGVGVLLLAGFLVLVRIVV